MNKETGKIILRISLSLVFLYFGFSQIISPDEWSSLVPEFLAGKIITVNNLVVMNGILEITLGIFLLIGLYTRFSALVLALHLGFITLHLGFNPIGIRDFGLTIATLSIFFNGIDKWTVDYRYSANTNGMEKNHLV